MATAREVIEQHITAFNTRDAEQEPWSPNAQLVAPGAAVEGRDAVLAFLAVFHEAFPDGRLQIDRLLSSGDGDAAVEGRFVGTHTGVLRSPAGGAPATGKAVQFRWAAVYVVRGAELASEHLYFDQLDLLGQLGLLPE